MQNKHFLIFDTVNVVTKSISYCLDGASIKNSLFQSQEELLDYISNEPVDNAALIMGLSDNELSDIQLNNNAQGPSGLKLLSTIRNQQSDLPLIVLLRQSQLTHLTKINELGAIGWIKLPFKSEQLKSGLNKIISAN